MAGRIKGITVEIGGDTTGLEKALKGVNSTIKNTQSQLKDVNRLLKLDPSNTELLSQKQRALKEAIGATTDKLETLKQAQAQAKQQLENGDLGQDKYDALQREIIETEQELRRLQEEAASTSVALAKIDEAGKKIESFGDSVTHSNLCQYGCECRKNCRSKSQPKPHVHPSANSNRLAVAYHCLYDNATTSYQNLSKSCCPATRTVSFSPYL